MFVYIINTSNDMAINGYIDNKINLSNDLLNTNTQKLGFDLYKIFLFVALLLQCIAFLIIFSIIVLSIFFYKTLDNVNNKKGQENSFIFGIGIVWCILLLLSIVNLSIYCIKNNHIILIIDIIITSLALIIGIIHILSMTTVIQNLLLLKKIDILDKCDYFCAVAESILFTISFILTLLYMFIQNKLKI